MQIVDRGGLTLPINTDCVTFVGGGCEQISSSDKQDKLAHNCANWGEGSDKLWSTSGGSLGVVIGLVHHNGFVKFM